MHGIAVFHFSTRRCAENLQRMVTLVFRTSTAQLRERLDGLRKHDLRFGVEVSLLLGSSSIMRAVSWVTIVLLVNQPSLLVVELFFLFSLLSRRVRALSIFEVLFDVSQNVLSLSGYALGLPRRGSLVLHGRVVLLHWHFHFFGFVLWRVPRVNCSGTYTLPTTIHWWRR